MFESLTEKLQGTFSKLRGRGKLSDSDIDGALREVRLALIAADVNYGIVKKFTEDVKARAMGQEVMQSLTPGQQVVKIVNEEMVSLMGGESSGITTASDGPTILVLAGLQGSGKTTMAGKLARRYAKEGKKPLLVAADIEGDRREGRIRIGAAIDPSELDAFGGDVERIETLRWDKHRNDLLLRVERRLGGIELAVTESRPEPGPATTAALLDRARDTRLSDLGWSDSARQLQNRLGFLRHHHSDNWPAVDDEVLLESIEDWLPGFLPNASRRADLRAVDMGMVLSTFVNFDQHTDLGRLAPTSTKIPSGRSVNLSYDTVEPPKVSARVQELYGTAETPSILDGKMAITFEMLSPAGRPIQVTSDLAGFWQGSWAEVRKEMAAKYPKHNWPADPTTATPAKPNERPKRGR